MFDNAWEHHYKNNKHHPEYWIDRINDITVYRQMPVWYFVEMICDWISVSMVNKSSVADWWFNHGRKEKVEMLEEKDIKLIDDFISYHKDDLDFSNKV